MSALTAADTAAVLRGPRLGYLDRFRGLAILLMMSDHLCLVLGGPVLIRETLGRLAMPAFFVLAGTLAGRLRWRHAGIALAGVGMGLAVPWIDSRPNVLTAWAIGCVLLWACERAGVPVWALAVVALGCYANGWSARYLGSYELTGLVGLMAVGRATVYRESYAWAWALPAWVGAMGRHPVLWYCGHLLVLESLLLLAGGH